MCPSFVFHYFHSFSPLFPIFPHGNHHLSSCFPMFSIWNPIITHHFPITFPKKNTIGVAPWLRKPQLIEAPWSTLQTKCSLLWICSGHAGAILWVMPWGGWEYEQGTTGIEFPTM
jgi:hypothetical protein